MELTLDFGELGSFTFSSIEEMEYVASYLGWKKTFEKTVQVYDTPIEVEQEDGTIKTIVPTRPETQIVPNEMDARTFLVQNSKSILADIPAKAFAQKIEEDIIKMKESQIEALRQKISAQIVSK